MIKQIVISAALLVSFAAGPKASATPALSIDNLVANYYLDRDKEGVSVLSVEEALTVAFPLSGASFTGIRRSIPANYLKNSNDLKITAVTDSHNNPVPYKTSFDKDKNLVLDIGNPKITLFGDEIFIIHYQSRGVINFLSDHQEFYPNFNGRGWAIPFNELSAIIHIPNNLAGSFKGQPVCLIDSGSCNIKTINKDKETQVLISANNSLSAHQSLTAKIPFKNGTFKPYAQNHLLNLLKVIGVVALLLLALLAVASGTRRLIAIIWHRGPPEKHL